MVRFVLASGSPRRKELLDLLGLEFEISSAHGEEIITKTQPADIVEELSQQKANEVADRFEERYKNDTCVIIGADTIVAFENEIMGKPQDEEDAVRMLAQLAGNTHQVYTGVTLAILENGERRSLTFHEKTDVCMYPMTKAQIQAYVATGEPSDKAGAYAIQGKCAAYIKGINGEYNNVVGLPVARLMQELFALKLIQ